MLNPPPQLGRIRQNIFYLEAAKLLLNPKQFAQLQPGTLTVIVSLSRRQGLNLAASLVYPHLEKLSRHSERIWWCSRRWLRDNVASALISYQFSHSVGFADESGADRIVRELYPLIKADVYFDNSSQSIPELNAYVESQLLSCPSGILVVDSLDDFQSEKEDLTALKQLKALAIKHKLTVLATRSSDRFEGTEASEEIVDCTLKIS